MTSVRCFFELIRKQMILFFREFLSRLIDISCILCTWVLVFSYLMTHSGLKDSYGAFILVGAIASFGLFETLWGAIILAQDASDKKLSHLFLLPLPSSWVFIAISVAWAASTGILSLCLFPLGKLILWSKFDFSHFSISKFSLIFLASALFYGFFALWIASLVTNLRKTSWLWARIINPLYMFCGFFYSWSSVYDASHVVGYLHFFNPLIFILEGTKGAVLGPEGYLPFFVCFFVTVVFTLIFGYDAIRRFKKRLDVV